MKEIEVCFEGSSQRIYSGNYLIAKGYNRAFQTEAGVMIEIAPIHWNKRYMALFTEAEQLSSIFKRYHHTSDIHGVVEECKINSWKYQAGMYYIPAHNVDYYPHNRTDIRRYRLSHLDGLCFFSRGPAPDKPVRKIFTVLGHRPRGKDERSFDIYNKDIYGQAREFFKLAFKLAIEKYGREQVVLLTNGYIGYNQLAQDVALEMNISVWLHIPFKGFTDVWKDREIKVFQHLAKDSYLTDMGQGKIPNKGERIRCLSKSNELLIDKCHQLLTVYDGERIDEVYRGILYAQQKKIHITNFFPNKSYYKDFYKI